MRRYVSALPTDDVPVQPQHVPGRDCLQPHRQLRKLLLGIAGGILVASMCCDGVGSGPAVWVLTHSTLCLSCMHSCQCVRRSEAGSVMGADAAKPHLAACGAAAAWRLGQWELLDSYLEQTRLLVHMLDAGDQWEVRLGELLSALHRRRTSCSIHSFDIVPRTCPCLILPLFIAALP